MPSIVVKRLADQLKLPIEEVEKKWEEAKSKVKEEYPEHLESEPNFWALVMTVFKKIMNVKDSLEEDGEGAIANTSTSVFTGSDGKDTMYKVPVLDTVARGGSIKKPEVKRPKGVSRMLPSKKEFIGLFNKVNKK